MVKLGRCPKNTHENARGSWGAILVIYVTGVPHDITRADHGVQAAHIEAASNSPHSSSPQTSSQESPPSGKSRLLLAAPVSSASASQTASPYPSTRSAGDTQNAHHRSGPTRPPYSAGWLGTSGPLRGHATLTLTDGPSWRCLVATSARRSGSY